MSDPAPPRRRLLLRFAAAAVLFALFAGWRLADAFPPLPHPLVATLELAPGEPGRSDPLVVSGATGFGDFLVVRFVDERTVRFVYDSWGFPGLESPPVPLPPDRRLELRLVLPALDQYLGSTAPESRRLRVEADGIQLLDAEVHHYLRAPAQLWFGENSLGGTACGETLRGRLVLPEGRELRGGLDRLFGFRERLLHWLRHHPGQPILLAAFAALAAFHVHRLRRLPAAALAGLRLAAAHRAFVLSASAATVAFAWLVTLGSFRFGHAEVFGSFYDYQAASFLSGRLDVPEIAIQGEAFEARGKIYGYFGPTPALLRLPFVVAGLGFGHLSRAFMLGYFVAALLATYLILRTSVRLAGSAAPPPAFSVVVLTLSAGLGSTMFFLGSRGLIFHEAILCGIAFALGSVWCSLRYLAADRSATPPRAFWLAALLLGVASLHARPPTGLFALVFLGCVALARLAATWRAAPAAACRHAVLVGCLALAGQLSLNGFAWLKFRTFDPAPLRISRPYMGSDRLLAIDGRSFHLSNLPFNFYSYVARPNLEFSRHFPWIRHGPALSGDDFPGAKIDLPDHTVGLPWSSPGLFVPAIAGTVLAAFAVPALAPAVVCLWAAAAPMALALFAAIATAQRYTGDFVPFLILGSALALAALDARPSRARRPLRVLLTLLTLAGIVVTFALTLHYQRATLWGVPEELRESYRATSARIDAFFGVPPAPPPPPP